MLPSRLLGMPEASIPPISQAMWATGSPASTSSMWPPVVFVLGNYGREFLSDMPQASIVGGTNLNVLNSEPDHWYVKAGLRERWSSLGHSVLYGFYGQRNDMLGAGAVANDHIVGSETTEWGLGACRKSMPPPCPSGCSTTTSTARLTALPVAAERRLLLRWRVGARRRHLYPPALFGLEHRQLVKGGALINF